MSNPTSPHLVQTPSSLPFHYGVCYYPEHWHPSRHASDIARIAEAGFNVVRMGESAWSYWEPREGEYQFELFDRVIDLCKAHGLKVILGTPTYAGPAWIAANYPEVLRWDYNRTPMAHGSRRNFNYTSPKYLELSDRIVTALAEHYKDEAQVYAWQIDNEFNCHLDVSYAPSDTVAWREWLKERYQSLEQLNAAWGTAFWSQTYDDWAQIDLPHPTVTYLNPSVLLDESRFISDCVVRYARRQAEILRAHNPRWLLTHNHLFPNIDPPKLGAEVDVMSCDLYPPFVGAFSGQWPNTAHRLSQYRGLSMPFWIAEQNSGPGGQLIYLHETPRPGQMALWAFQSVAHGADTVIYFRWRTCPYGAEQHWHGLLDQDDRDNRRLAEAKGLGEALRALPEAFFSAPTPRAVAILTEYDNKVNDERINTFTRAGHEEDRLWSDVARRQHLAVDNRWSVDDLAGYKVIIAPHLRIADAALVAKLTEFVEAGGVLVLGGASGVYDRRLHVCEAVRPGLFRELAGVEVEDWTSVPDRVTPTAVLPDGTPLPMLAFVERLTPLTSDVVARWDGSDPLLAQAPAVTLNHVGAGRVYYIGGYCTRASIEALLPQITVGLNAPAIASGNVEMVERTLPGERRLLALLNHSRDSETVSGLCSAKVLSHGLALSTGGELVLPGFATAVVELV